MMVLLVLLLLVLFLQGAVADVLPKASWASGRFNCTPQQPLQHSAMLPMVVLLVLLLLVLLLQGAVCGGAVQDQLGQQGAADSVAHVATDTIVLMMLLLFLLLVVFSQGAVC
jgi:hypothetical protein